MSDKVWKCDEVQSPCNAICLIHPEAKICIGCYRSIKEISDWSKMSGPERTALLAELPARAPLVSKRRGGRKARRRKP